jgi:hypothetical protein
MNAQVANEEVVMGSMEDGEADVAIVRHVNASLV